MSVRVAINGFGRIGRNILRGGDRGATARISKSSPSTISRRSKPTPICCASIPCMAVFPARSPSKATASIAATAPIKVTALQRPGAAAVERTRRRRRAGMHRDFHVEGKSRRTSDRRREARADLGACRWRRSHRGLRRQSRQTRQRRIP